MLRSAPRLLLRGYLCAAGRGGVGARRVRRSRGAGTAASPPATRSPRQQAHTDAHTAAGHGRAGPGRAGAAPLPPPPPSASLCGADAPRDGAPPGRAGSAPPPPPGDRPPPPPPRRPRLRPAPPPPLAPPPAKRGAAPAAIGATGLGGGEAAGKPVPSRPVAGEQRSPRPAGAGAPAEPRQLAPRSSGLAPLGPAAARSSAPAGGSGGGGLGGTSYDQSLGHLQKRSQGLAPGLKTIPLSQWS